MHDRLQSAQLEHEAVPLDYLCMPACVCATRCDRSPLERTSELGSPRYGELSSVGAPGNIQSVSVWLTLVTWQFGKVQVKTCKGPSTCKCESSTCQIREPVLLAMLGLFIAGLHSSMGHPDSKALHRLLGQQKIRPVLHEAVKGLKCEYYDRHRPLEPLK
eukprot:3209579-Amphidinium_carterae.2